MILLSVFDSKLVDTFNELFQSYELYDLKELIELKYFLFYGAIAGYLSLIIHLVVLIRKSIKAFVKGLKG